jgi:DHA3 family macrolide efflux protein-like MFS transporter
MRSPPVDTLGGVACDTLREGNDTEGRARAGGGCRATRPLGDLVKNKDLLRVAAARFISRAGGEAAFFVGVWGKAAYELHATPAQIALLMGVLSVSSIIGTVLSGVLVDRFDARRVLMVAEAFFVPITLAFIFAVGFGPLTVLVGLLGFFGAPVMTAAASFAPFMADDETPIETVNAWIEGASSSSFVIGPGIGAVLVSLVGINAIWVFDGLTSLAAVILVWRVTLRPAPRPAQARSHPFAELREGLRYTYSHRSLRYPILLGTATWLAFGAFSALEPLFYRDVLRTGVATIGWVNTLFGVGLVCGAWLFTRLPSRVTSARGLAFVCSAVGLGALAYVGTRLLPVVAVGALVWGVIIGVADVLLRTLIQTSSPDELVGRIAGTSQMHRQAGELLPLALAPALAAAFGVQAVLVGGGLVLSVVALLTLGEARAVDRLPVVRPTRAVGRLLASDEPISPNP